ncbi:oxygen-dependent protoporphyrinogen oxidase [Saitoella coloradoensis]
MAAPPVKSVAVIGSGISGLTAAYYARRHLPPSTPITIYESHPAHLGGWLQTTQHSIENKGVIFEHGPRSLRPVGLSGLCTFDLIRELGLEKELILVPKTHPSAKNRYVYYKGGLNKLPSALLELPKAAATVPILRGLVSSIAHEPFAAKRPEGLEDESIGSFVRRRFGVRGVGVDTLLSAIVHGIYAADLDQLSVRSTFPILWDMETYHGSVVKGMLGGAKRILKDDREVRQEAELKEKNKELVEMMNGMSVYSFKDGLATLTERLRTSLSNDNVTFMLGTPVTDLSISPSSATITAGSDNASFSHVIANISPKTLASIAPSLSLPTPPSTSSSTVLLVNLFFPPSAALHVPAGFGYLIPKTVGLDENPHRALGIVFDSHGVPGQDSAEGVKLTVMLGGHWWSSLSPSELAEREAQGVDLALDTVRRHLGITTKPILAEAHLQRECIPQYGVGHRGFLGKAKSVVEGRGGGRLSVVGAGWGGVSVNDCVRGGRDIGIGLGGGVTGLERWGQ